MSPREKSAGSEKAVKTAEKERGGNSERIDYGALAAELGITRNAFKYHIDKLKRAKIVTVAGDKMKLSDGIIIEINEEEQREESG